MYKQYKLEFGLGLGGAIAGIMAFIYTLLFTLVFLFGFSIGTIPIIIGLTFMLAAFIIAFVLAKGAEEAFRQSLVLSNSGIGIFLERPVAIAFLGLGFAVIVGRSVSVYRQKRQAA